MTQDRQKRILIIDDDVSSADLLAEAVRLMGYDAVVAYSGRSALDIASTYLPDIALIDLVMPEVDGYMVAAALRHSSVLGETRLIAVTASVDTMSRYRAVSCGFNDFIVKPAVVHLLIEAIEKQLSYQTAPTLAARGI